MNFFVKNNWQNLVNIADGDEMQVKEIPKVVPTCII